MTEPYHGLTLRELEAVRGTSRDDPSGARRAQQAHDAGAVTPPDVRPTHQVVLELRAHGDGRDVRELADAVAVTLAGHPLVLPPVTVSVEERKP